MAFAREIQIMFRTMPKRTRKTASRVKNTHENLLNLRLPLFIYRISSARRIISIGKRVTNKALLYPKAAKKSRRKIERIILVTPQPGQRSPVIELNRHGILKPVISIII